MLNETKHTFNGSNDTTNGTITYPNINHEVYQEVCPHCHGVGHIHCSECKKESPCPECGGSGKKNVYQGNIYKIFWNVPYTEDIRDGIIKPQTTC